MNRELWQHQSEALMALRQSVRQGVYRIVVMSPTGSGKTVLAASLAESALRKGKKLAFVVSHLSLIDQVVTEFYNEGIKDVGVIQQNHQLTDYGKPIQICSIATLRSRNEYPKCNAIIFDEVHCLHKYHKQWLAHPDYQHVPIVGISATPWTRGLGRYFNTLLIAATTKELMAKGLLSKYRAFASAHPDLSGVRVVAGDYVEDELSAAMQRGTLTADIVQTWKERWNKDKTILYAVDCAHAKALQERFIEAGIVTAYQDAKTPTSERADIKRKFHTGEYRIVCNVGTLTTGVDWDVRCLIMARPTKSEMLWVQMVGRALRTAAGKEWAMLLDHSDNTQRLGFVEDIHHDHLDDGKPKQKQQLLRKALPKPCPRCDSMLPRTAGVCVNCGHKIEKQVSGLIERDGELFEIVPGARPKKSDKPKATMDEKATFFAGLKYYCMEKGYKPGWAINQYKAKFKVWPNDPNIRFVAPRPPTTEVKQWIRHGQIRWAMSKKNEQRRATA